MATLFRRRNLLNPSSLELGAGIVSPFLAPPMRQTQHPRRYRRRLPDDPDCDDTMNRAVADVLLRRCRFAMGFLPVFYVFVWCLLAAGGYVACTCFKTKLKSFAKTVFVQILASSAFFYAGFITIVLTINVSPSLTLLTDRFKGLFLLRLTSCQVS